MLLLLLATEFSQQTIIEGNVSKINIELVISIIALMISVGSSVFEYFWNRHISRKNAETEIYKDIFIEYLIKKIPEARNKIHYGNEILSDIDDLVNVLNDLRRDILFFKFSDNCFYRELYKKLQKLEDKLVTISGKKIDADEFADFHKGLDEDIHNIYNFIMKKYIGKRVK
ncbi:MAG: hypothetical protein J1E98_11595 [Lachnospiraceae bacterium]|nr:hypothetical protein [Lachnospiraceae bacterium]